MRILLLWRSPERRGDDLDPERVARKLQQIFSPLFSRPPRATIRQTPATTTVFLELPVRGWKPPFFEEDEQTWALAVEYPIDAQAALDATGIHVRQDTFLPTLCRSLEGHPTSLLRDMAPPFSLVWASKQSGETFVQNDGLGQAQLFEYQDDRFYALTNKIFALKALGVELELEPEDWAVRCTLPWFPLDRTGYKRTRFLGPGTQIRLGSSGVSRTMHDVLGEWVNPGALSQADCLELARCSLLKQIKAAMPLWEKPTAGLTGGWDTRAVVATLRFLDADFSARVRGAPEHYDVIIASELARIAGLDLKVQEYPGLPPETTEDCRRSISLALLWQAGYMVSDQHKEFLANRGHLQGFVNIMGQHGEIGRAFFAKMIQSETLREEQYEDHLIQKFMARMPPFMRRSFHERIRHFIREAYRQADRYSLTGLARLDFSYLCERSRRWASGSLNSQPGVVVTPFLNPGYIRATFGYQGRGKETNPFHRHIIATYAPEWLGVPNAKDLQKAAVPGMTVKLSEHGTSETGFGGSWRQCTGTRNYDAQLYWKEVGEPIIREALAEGGFWTEIFDPDLAKQQWHVAPDHLAILHLLPHVLEGHFLS
jgi:hypothetical protein